MSGQSPVTIAAVAVLLEDAEKGLEAAAQLGLVTLAFVMEQLVNSGLDGVELLVDLGHGRCQEEHCGVIGNRGDSLNDAALYGLEARVEKAGAIRISVGTNLARAVMEPEQDRRIDRVAKLVRCLQQRGYAHRGGDGMERCGQRGKGNAKLGEMVERELDGP